MAEVLAQSDALLDFRRAVGLLAAKMDTDVSRWQELAESHTVEYLVGELVTSWQRLAPEPPAAGPTEGI